MIELQPEQLITGAGAAEPAVAGGRVVADPARDLAKIAVVERHHATGRIGVGLVHGFGLRRGAFASTVAHDAHNIVVVGVDDASMRAASSGSRSSAAGSRSPTRGAARRAGAAGRGSAVGGAGGRRSSGWTSCSRCCASGPSPAAPFMTLSFLALSVIPELKLTDHGLVDVERFEIVPFDV